MTPATRQLATLASIAGLIALSFALAGPAQAQSSPSTIAGGGSPTVVQETPASTAGAVVFFIVCAVIIGGAVILYLRNRPPRSA